jgi:hypothetical protein
LDLRVETYPASLRSELLTYQFKVFEARLGVVNTTGLSQLILLDQAVERIA